MKRNKTQKIAFSGVMSAVCVALLYLGSVIEVLDYSASALAGLVVTLVIVEFGDRAGIGVWLVSSVLSLILLPVKSAALLFIVFCGWYSFAKRWLERLTPVLSWVLKLVLFNLCLAVIYLITVKLLLIQDVTPLITASVILLANGTFLIYDVLITRIIILYVRRLRPRLSFLKK